MSIRMLLHKHMFALERVFDFWFALIISAAIKGLLSVETGSRFPFFFLFRTSKRNGAHYSIWRDDCQAMWFIKPAINRKRPPHLDGVLNPTAFVKNSSYAGRNQRADVSTLFDIAICRLKVPSAFSRSWKDLLTGTTVSQPYWKRNQRDYTTETRSARWASGCWAYRDWRRGPRCKGCRNSWAGLRNIQPSLQGCRIRGCRTGPPRSWWCPERGTSRSSRYGSSGSDLEWHDELHFKWLIYKKI